MKKSEQIERFQFEQGDRALRELNTGDSATPISLNIDIKWFDFDFPNRWTPENYLRLCSLLRSTEYEVASTVGIRHTRIARFLNREIQLKTTEFICITMLAIGSLGADVTSQIIGEIPQDTFSAYG